jgi:hypothetical protein
MIQASSGQMGRVGEQVGDLNRAEYWPTSEFESTTSTLFIDVAMATKTGHDHGTANTAATAQAGEHWWGEPGHPRRRRHASD